MKQRPHSKCCFQLIVIGHCAEASSLKNVIEEAHYIKIGNDKQQKHVRRLLKCLSWILMCSMYFWILMSQYFFYPNTYCRFLRLWQKQQWFLWIAHWVPILTRETIVILLKISFSNMVEKDVTLLDHTHFIGRQGLKNSLCVVYKQDLPITCWWWENLQDNKGKQCMEESKMAVTSLTRKQIKTATRKLACCIVVKLPKFLLKMTLVKSASD